MALVIRHPLHMTNTLRIAPQQPCDNKTDTHKSSMIIYVTNVVLLWSMTTIKHVVACEKCRTSSGVQGKSNKPHQKIVYTKQNTTGVYVPMFDFNATTICLIIRSCSHENICIHVRCALPCASQPKHIIQCKIAKYPS